MSVILNHKDELSGTIITDMDNFLKFIKEKNLTISGKAKLLPTYCLPELNTLMSHQLKLKLKREQQISYPHIGSLYTLSRRLGLVQIVKVKSEHYLVLNEKSLDSYNKLNSTEKYFTLMQIWLLCDDDKFRKNMFSTHISLLIFINEKLQDILVLNNAREQDEKLYIIKLYNLSLLEMFGMVTIEDSDDDLRKKSWAISKIAITNLGKKISKILSSFKRLNIEYKEDVSLFYSKIKSVFPEWKTYFEREIKETNNNLYFFKISLTKNIWRKISIQGSNNLDGLAHMILSVYNFDYTHLYQFKYINSYGVEKHANHSECLDGPYADDIKIGDIDILVGDSMEFLYDFGDCWKFDIQLEKIDNDLKIDNVTLIESVGESPKQYDDEEKSY